MTTKTKSFFSKQREKKKMNQSEFAKLVGISQANLSKLENEKICFSISVIEKASKKLKIPYETLIKENNKLKKKISKRVA